MNDDVFEWDDVKAVANYAKHGVSFQRARLAFADPFGVAEYDDRDDYGEDRFIRIGMSKALCSLSPIPSAEIGYA